MPLELLHALARAPLPVRITDPTDIDKLRALQAAGFALVLLMLSHVSTPHSAAEAPRFAPFARVACQ